jgi:hypothetical protein
MKHILPLALALLAATPAAAQTLSKAEAKTAATIDAEADRTLAFLVKMVEQNSGSLNTPGVVAVAISSAPNSKRSASPCAGRTWPPPTAPDTSSPPTRAMAAASASC